MQEKLSVAKVYRNAYRFVSSHLFAFAFLTVFYFLGSLLPMLIGITFFKVFFMVYLYLFFYFAAGCYYKQQILWDREIFVAAGLRFLTAVALFCIALLCSSVGINLGINFLKITFSNGEGIIDLLLNSPIWLIGKYLFIFTLFVVFFIVPSFAFVSEITGDNRSLLTTFVVTKGNLFNIGVVVFISFMLLLLIMYGLVNANMVIATFIRSIVLVFVSILYFKMYDFFYIYPKAKENVKEKKSSSAKNNKAVLEEGNAD